MIQTRTITRLVLAMAATVILAGALLAAAIAMLGGRSLWWNGWVAAVVASSLAALMSVAPVIAGIMIGGQWTVYGHLAGSALRVLVAALASVGAVLAFRAPPTQTLVLMVPLYFAQLIVEAVVVGRAYRTGGQVG